MGDRKGGSVMVRVRTGKVTPVLKDRSDPRRDPEGQTAKLLPVVYALLAQAEEAARAEDSAFKHRRLSEAQRVLRTLPVTKETNRARTRVDELRSGMVEKKAKPKGRSGAAGQKAPQPNSTSSDTDSSAAKALRAQRKREAAAAKARQQQERKTALRRQRCRDCGVPGEARQLGDKSGAPRCAPCHAKWAQRRCARCGRTFTRSAADARARNCFDCRPTRREIYTVSAGAPSLGRRR